MKDEKEEIKPAPLGEQELLKLIQDKSDQLEAKHKARIPKGPDLLVRVGESSEEQKDGFMIIDVFNDDGSHSHYALISTKTGEKLWSENPKECKAQGYPVSSPASEPPEEQEELWDEVLNYCANHYINDVRVREYMQKNFIIHRKRD